MYILGFAGPKANIEPSDKEERQLRIRPPSSFWINP